MPTLPARAGARSSLVAADLQHQYYLKIGPLRVPNCVASHPRAALYISISTLTMSCLRAIRSLWSNVSQNATSLFCVAFCGFGGREVMMSKRKNSRDSRLTPSKPSMVELIAYEKTTITSILMDSFSWHQLSILVFSPHRLMSDAFVTSRGCYN